MFKNNHVSNLITNPKKIIEKATSCIDEISNESLNQNNPDSLDETIVKTQRLYSGYPTIENPVKDYWEIKLYSYIDKVGDYTFKVKLTSQKVIVNADGMIIKQSEYIDEYNFENKEKNIKLKLRKKGDIDDIIYKGIVSYVGYLKRSNQYEFIEDEGNFTLTDNPFKNLEHESIEYYECFIEEIKKSPSSFKVSSSKNIFKLDEHDGILEENYKNTGYSAIVIEGEILKDILGISDKNEFENILRIWRKNSLLLSGNTKQTRMTTRYTFCSKCRKSAYVIKIDNNISNFVCKYHHL